MNTPTIDVDPSDNQATPVTAEVSIIIVNWNSRDFVRQCLASLYRHTSGFAFEVIVVDGASYDGCKEMLEAEFSSVRFVQCEKNVGFARANNLGAEQAQGTTLLFLNPDTELLDDAPADLVRILRSTPEAGLVGCRLLNSDRSVQTSCVQALPTVFNQFFDSEYLRSRFPHWRTWGTVSLQIGSGEPMVVQAVSGACMTIARSDFVAVGGFTPSYFMYGEECSSGKACPLLSQHKHNSPWRR
jgi:GT2 family glycosyltransferase